MRYRVVCRPLPTIDSYQACSPILMFPAWTSASRLVSSIAVVIHSFVSCLYPTRMCRARGLRGESDTLRYEQAERERYDKMGVTSVQAVVALERRSTARGVVSSSAGCACCRARWCVPSTFGIVMAACCCCQPCSASIRCSTGFSPVAANRNRNSARPRERSCRVSRPRLVSAPVERRASRFSCGAR